jgi:hypothetical protein
MTDGQPKDKDPRRTSDEVAREDDGEGVETIRRRVEEGLERLVPEVIKRTVEAGLDTLSRSERGRLRSLVNELRIPRDVTRYLLAQVDETKNALLRVFAGEVRDFLESTDLAEDIKRVLTSVSLEVSTQIRFIPNEPRAPVEKPENADPVSTPRARSAAVKR